MSLSGSWVRDQFALVICRYHPWGCIHSTKGFWRSRVGRDGKVACLHGSQNYFLTARAALPRNWTLPSWFCFWKCKCWKWTSSAFLMEKCTTVPLMSRSLYAESVTWDTYLEVLFVYWTLTSPVMHYAASRPKFTTSIQPVLNSCDERCHVWKVHAKHLHILLQQQRNEIPTQMTSTNNKVRIC